MKTRLKIAKVIAIVATVISVLGFILMVAGKSNGTIWCIGIMIGIASYIFGGLIEALKMIWKIGITGFIVMPFPTNIAAGTATIIVGLFVACSLPIIPIQKTIDAQ